jgi:hypothetical protein
LFYRPFLNPNDTSRSQSLRFNASLIAEGAPMMNEELVSRLFTMLSRRHDVKHSNGLSIVLGNLPVSIVSFFEQKDLWDILPP